MSESFSNSYAAAGVDVTAGYKAVELMKKHVERTSTPEVLSSIGGFGGMVMPNLTGIAEPVLVSGTDGVGTKLKIAFLADRHDTVGIDCVAMCVNDIACCGARPLFFLDYIACGKNVPERIAQIVSGVAEGCVRGGCALVGGETAEMPGFYSENEYDIAGFSVGLVDKNRMIDGSRIKDGDLIIGLASSGVHSNGFSLVRKILDVENADLNAYMPELGCSLADELLKPTRIYCRTVTALVDTLGIDVHGMCHITGGGFFENVPRMLPEGIRAVISPANAPVPPIFNLLQERGGIETREMYNTFNMGIGYMLAIDSKDSGVVMDSLVRAGERPYVIGRCVSGEKGVELKW